MKNCLVVLGMHRSGTSAFTGILDRLGVDLGGKLLETQADNEKGFFENKFVVQANDAMLEALGTSWDDTFPMPDDWQNYFSDSRMAQDIRTFLRRDIGEDRLAAMKDPRLCRLLPYWLPQFAAENVQPHFAIVIRNPLEIAQSLSSRNGFSQEKSLVLWMQYMLDAEAHTRHLPRGFVEFSSLLESPRETVEKVFKATQLELPAPVSTDTGSDVRGNSSALDDFLDASLRHHSASTGELRESGFELAADLFERFCAIAERGQATAVDCDAIDAIGEQFVQQQQLFINRDVLTLRDELHHRESPEQQREALQALRKQFEADQLHREYRYIANTRHLSKEVASLSAQREELAAERNSLRADRDALVTERDALRLARDELSRERDELRAVRDELVRERDELRTNRDDIAAARTALASEVDALNNRIKEQITAHSRAIGERDTLAERIRLLEEEQHSFRSSPVWKLYRGYRNSIEKTLPEGSLRRQVARRTKALVTPEAPHHPQMDVVDSPAVQDDRGPVAATPEAEGSIAVHTPQPEVAASSGQPTEDPEPQTEQHSTANADTTVEPAPPVEAGATEHKSAWEPLQFKPCNKPVTSIVIPVFNNWEFTWACLRSVHEHTTGEYEVIVVDNHSTDETPALLAAMQGITVITNETNEVFVNACNQAAATARGDYLLLLNNDTEVSPGWLQAMLAPFADATTGIVGAKLVYPDGRLQEAGGIIWADGTGCNYGHGDDPNLPQYNYRKAVDYCSGACLLIRRPLWDELGGFDSRYAPAYYEDTDLCFAARSLNYKVIYQPQACITHFGGASAGKETSSGYKRFQDINQHKFVEKWRDVLNAGHVLSSAGTHGARQRGGEKHILVIDHYVPTFDRDSGSQRMLSMLQILQNMGYRVSFWPDDLSYDPKYSKTLQDMGVETFYGDLHFEDYMAAHGESLDVVLMSRPATARKYLELVKKYTHARTIFDTVDLHFVREQRRLELEVQQWKDLEFYLAAETDNTFVVSPTEKKLLANEPFAQKVAVVSNIHSLEPCEKSFEERSGLMFIGGFAHPPNEEGVLWFIDYVLPQIRNKIPDMHLTIVGSEPTQRVLEKASDNITVAGFVEDVRDLFNSAKVFVSPLLHGAGVKGKIGQSFSFGLPVVTTSIGAEGMHLVDGHNALIADTETAFADKIVQLYTEQTLWQKLSVNGRKVITEQFSPATIRSALENVLHTPISGPAAAAKRKVLLHCHLFKNAGTTLDWSLQRHFGDAFVDHRDDDAMRRGGEYLGPYLAESSSIAALSSHHIQFPLPEPDDYDLLPLILLRHPIDRARSVYAFERRQEAFTPGAVKAKELDFAEYIRWRMKDDVAPTVRNFHCSHLTSSGKAVIERPRYEQALALLTRAPLVGTVERYDQSMILFEHSLAQDFPGIDLAYLSQNVTPNRDTSIANRIQSVYDELGEPLAREFREKNAWDIALHEDANAILTERLGAVAHTGRLLENFQARCRLLASTQ